MTGWAITCAVIGAMVAAYLAAVFAFAPAEVAYAQATHRADQMPMVMAGRYVTFGLFAAAAAASRDPRIIAATFAILAVPALWDTLLYAGIGESFVKHLAAGLAALIVSALGLAAHRHGAA